MKQYQELLARILEDGLQKGDRTGTGTRSVFGHQMRFDLTKGFPLVTTKRVFWRGVVEELLWMLSGSTNVKPLQEKGVTIWNEWARPDGELGPVYGKQWREWSTKHHGPVKDKDGDVWWMPKTIDQIQGVIDQLKTSPDSRRIIVTAWNPAEVDEQALPPCHMMFQFYTRPMTLQQRMNWASEKNGLKEEHYVTEPDYEKLGRVDRERIAWADHYGAPIRQLDLQLYQRSADVFLGVPFNIASYALLLALIAREVGMVPGEFIWTGGDTHLYLNHLPQAALQLEREPRPLPKLRIRPDAPGIFEITSSDIEIIDYDPWPKIEAEVSV